MINTPIKVKDIKKKLEEIDDEAIVYSCDFFGNDTQNVDVVYDEECNSVMICGIATIEVNLGDFQDKSSEEIEREYLEELEYLEN